MAIFKCKMCGGELEVQEGMTVCDCEYCGTKQTLPRIGNDDTAKLYDRAGHFRRANDFDKAAGIYEKILEQDNTDSEAYWSLVLCKYGVEYVEDPASHKRIPTVNRAQFTSVFSDVNYKSAIEYADVVQRSVYEQEAKAIDDIQKRILAISKNEAPYDVFICYKETDPNGERTRDSVYANDLYHQLTQEGFRVFFARISLEDKLGQEYEPYIFAALNSAKVMVVLGTKPEYFNAVWVKNEWSRFLTLMKEGDKTLIPAYKDMDPYDLPEEFSYLQSQDMGKLGFMQDLIRGIKKIVGKDQPAPIKPNNISVPTEDQANGTVDPLLKRGLIFLEDGIWDKADEYFEKALDIDPENGKAYLGKLLVELKVRKKEDLANLDVDLQESEYYSKTVRYGDKETSSYIESCYKKVKERINEKKYKDAVNKFNSITNVDDVEAIKKLFEEIDGYSDSNEYIQKCNALISNETKRIALVKNKRGKMIQQNILKYVNNDSETDTHKKNEAIALQDAREYYKKSSKKTGIGAVVIFPIVTVIVAIILSFINITLCIIAVIIGIVCTVVGIQFIRDAKNGDRSDFLDYLISHNTFKKDEKGVDKPTHPTEHETYVYYERRLNDLNKIAVVQKAKSITEAAKSEENIYICSCCGSVASADTYCAICGSSQKQSLKKYRENPSECDLMVKKSMPSQYSFLDSYSEIDFMPIEEKEDVIDEYYKEAMKSGNTTSVSNAPLYKEVSHSATPLDKDVAQSNIPKPEYELGAKSTYDVVLVSCNDSKMMIIKEIKDTLNLDLKSAKELVDAAPTVLLPNANKNDAIQMKFLLEKAGATIELK